MLIHKVSKCRKRKTTAMNNQDIKQHEPGKYTCEHCYKIFKLLDKLKADQVSNNSCQINQDDKDNQTKEKSKTTENKDNEETKKIYNLTLFKFYDRLNMQLPYSNCEKIMETFDKTNQHYQYSHL